jgi:hypothetical protein
MILSRGAGATLMAELAKPAFYPVLLVNLDWPSGEVWFHTGRGNITWDGQTWTGVGLASSVSIPEESFGLATSQAAIRIVGTFEDVFDATEERVKNMRAAIYIGCVSERAGSTRVGAPVAAFIGVMDGTLFASEDDGAYYLELTLASGPGARVNAAITHSGEDQKYHFPDDTAGRHTQFAVAEAAKIT